jgi:hypothetical protein
LLVATIPIIIAIVPNMILLRESHHTGILSLRL